MRISSSIHRVMPRFVWSFHFYVPWKGRKDRWAIIARNTDTFFAFTTYRRSKPVVSLGIWPQ